MSKLISYSNGYTIKLLNIYCKIVYSAERYDSIYNTVLFLRIIYVLLNTEYKCITDLELAKLVINTWVNAQMKNLNT